MSNTINATLGTTATILEQIPKAEIFVFLERSICIHKLNCKKVKKTVLATVDTVNCANRCVL